MFRCSMNMDTYSDRIKQNTFVDRRITPEQILQLCRILTERTANAHFELEYCIDRECSKELLSGETESKHISGEKYFERFSTEVDDRHQDQFIVDHPTGASVTSTKPKQAKKDILNKIRNQIFERKRQKLANVQRSITGVWRPW